MLPPAYAWLTDLIQPPRMLAEALKLHGTAETPGATHTQAILQWAAECGIAYRADETPWCGLFMALVARRAAKPVPENPLWALNWRRFGLPADRPMLGDVLVFQRPAGGHVGLYVGEDAAAFHVLGGNQGDRVSIVRIGQSRLKAVRRPVYTVRPASVQPIRLAAAGAVSVDEA